MSSDARQNELIFTTAPAEIRAAGESGTPARAVIAAYNGGLMTVPGFGPVVLDLAGLDAAASVALLADHDATIEGIVGNGQASIEAGRLAVAGTIDREADRGRKIISLAKSGFQFQASVGVKPGRWEFVSAGQSVQVNGRTIVSPPGGFRLVRTGKLREVSITALGADDSTSVNIQGRQKTMATNTNHSGQGEGEQFGEGIIEGGGNLAAAADHGAELDRVRREERERIADIDRICADVGCDVSDIRASAINGELSASALKQIVLERLRASRGNGPVITSRGGGDSIDRNTIEAAILLRAGFAEFAEKEYGEPVMHAADRLRGKSLADFCAAACQIDGRDVPRERTDIIRAGFSTMSLPNALGNAANKALLAVYKESPSSWEGFSSVKPAANFKDQSSIRPSFLGDFEQLPPDGEIKHSRVDEAVFTWKIDTFAKMLSFTRQDVINDDLSLIDETIPALARMAKRKLSDLVWETIISNTGSFFSADNNNLLTGADSALSVDGLGAAIAAMRTQRTADGTDLDIQPRVLVVPPELEQVAKGVLESEYLERLVETGTDRQPTGNPLRKSLSLAVEPRLSNSDKFSGTSEDAWYLFAGPMDVPAIVGFLDGRRVPTTEFFGMNADRNHLGVSYRAYHDFGFALGDSKAAVKSAGS